MRRLIWWLLGIVAALRMRLLRTYYSAVMIIATVIDAIPGWLCPGIACALVNGRVRTGIVAAYYYSTDTPNCEDLRKCLPHTVTAATAATAAASNRVLTLLHTGSIPHMSMVDIDDERELIADKALPFGALDLSDVPRHALTFTRAVQ